MLKFQMNLLRINRLKFTPCSPISRAPYSATSIWRTSITLRTFASDAAPENAKPPKPKASTPLRRAASASLPIRANPTPTRSSIQPVFTLTTAERYALGRISAHLPPSSAALHDAWWVPKYNVDGKEGEVFVFGNGSIVCWGLGEEQAAQFASEVIAKSKAEIAPLKEPETEDLEFVTDPSE